MGDPIELKTAPADFRFPTTNQTRHCFTRYIEFHRCLAAKGEESNECERFAKYYRSLCPGEWVERWNEQRENGTFPEMKIRFYGVKAFGDGRLGTMPRCRMPDRKLLLQFPQQLSGELAQGSSSQI
ncbi:hypothetical protein Pint_14289 [Pistacia integerrima]|uniref:Uncharacterized protein n=1 Tax=Pistacia integerrima TaxID=434235 RepID=A0ACC0YBS5_9ROSI|nr:hypothetical protein Pint_14289 [Pistacia integerrima]